MKEEWKDIVGYDGLYQVSNFGYIKSLSRKFSPKEKILKPGKDRYGYLRVVLCKNSITESFHIHKLILLTFIGKCPKNMQCRHLDGNKLNNRLDNLCWGSSKENTFDKIQHGTMKGIFKNGENHIGAKLEDQKIIEILELIRKNEFTQKEIANIYNVSRQTIYDIDNNKTWKHINRE